MLSSARFSISKSLDTHELLQFVPFPRCTGSPDVRFVLLASFLTSSRVGARNEEAERRVLLASISLSLRLLASLIMYLIPSRSVYLLRDLSVSSLLSLDLTQIPRIIQTRWLKPSGITTDKRNPVLGIRLLYLPIMVVICPGKQSLPSSPWHFFAASLLRNAAYILNAYAVAPFSLHAAAYASLYAYLTFFFLLL